MFVFRIPCHLTKIKENFFETQYSYLVGTNFRYGEAFRQFSMKLQSSATMTHYIKSQLKTNIKVERNIIDTSVTEISFAHTYIIFFGYLSGMCASVLILLIEIWVKNRWLI